MRNRIWVIYFDSRTWTWTWLTADDLHSIAKACNQRQQFRVFSREHSHFAFHCEIGAQSIIQCIHTFNTRHNVLIKYHFIDWNFYYVILYVCSFLVHSSTISFDSMKFTVSFFSFSLSIQSSAKLQPRTCVHAKPAKLVYISSELYPLFVDQWASNRKPKLNIDSVILFHIIYYVFCILLFHMSNVHFRRNSVLARLLNGHLAYFSFGFCRVPSKDLFSFDELI